MPTTITRSLILKSEEPSEIDSKNRGTHERTWRHYVSDQTDVGGAIILLAMALVDENRCPEIGETYNYGGLDDEGSYCQRIRVWRPEPLSSPEMWNITAYFMPLSEGTTDGTITEPNPLSWATVYDVDYLEEQVPLETAVNLDDLSHVGRPAGTNGPLVNSCGVEFIDPVLTTETYPILLARKNYATLNEIIALNTAFQKTVNNDTFFGAAAGTAKYLTTESGGQQKVGGVTFYPGTTKIIIKDAGWDRKILNNGMSHLESFGGTLTTRTDNDTGVITVTDDEHTIKVGHKVTVSWSSGIRRKMNVTAVTGTAITVDAGSGNNLPSSSTSINIAKRRPAQNKVCHDPNSAAERKNEDEPCSEPLNLALNGNLTPKDTAATYLTYEELGPVAYSGIGIGGA